MQITTLPQDLSIPSVDSIQLYDYRNPEDIVKTKINLSKHTISFLRLGTKEVIGQQTTAQIDQSSFLVMKSGNCLMTEKVSNANQMYHSILLFFDDQIALDFIEKYGRSLKVNHSNEQSFFVFQYDAFIRQYVDSLSSLLVLPPITQRQILKTKFEELMLYLAHLHGHTFLHAMIQKMDDRMGHFTQIVEHNKLNKLTLEELAFLCNMSISTFKRAFFKAYQETPMKWFNEQRFIHIANLLRTQQKRPIEVYEDAGYENYSNFVQAFKKRFGLTPKQYQIQD